MDGITSETLKYEGKAVTDLMHTTCNPAWMEGKMSGDWTKAIIVSVCKGKGLSNDFGND